MSDLIDRKALLDHLDLCLAESDGKTPITDAVIISIKCAVQQMPKADAVEVVRCKDCLHSAMYCFGNSNIPTLACVDVDEDGNIALATAVSESLFCADGKRKDDVSE